MQSQSEMNKCGGTNLLLHATGLLRKSLPQPNCPSRPLQQYVSSHSRENSHKAAPAPHIQLRCAAVASNCTYSCYRSRVLPAAVHKIDGTGYGHTARPWAATWCYTNTNHLDENAWRTCCWCCRYRAAHLCCTPTHTLHPVN